MVSVVLVNYYSAELTACAVRSVTRDDSSAEVIVVDNSACADEAQTLRSLLPDHARLIVSETNGGFGQGCNLGYAHATGEYIFLLNPDTEVIPGCIYTLIEALNDFPDAAAVSPEAYWNSGTDYLLPYGELQTPFGETLVSAAYRFAVFGRFLSMRYRRMALSHLTDERPQRQSMLSGAHMMIRRSSIEALGSLFDEAFFLYYEDTDLNLRLQQKGGRLLMVPKAKVIHRWKSDPAKGKHGPESRARYMDKHFKYSWWWKIKEMIERCSVAPAENFSDLGTLEHPVSFDVEGMGAGILEIGVNHLFIPSSVHRFSAPSKETITIPKDVWELLGSGTYWARIGHENGPFRVYRWSIQ